VQPGRPQIERDFGLRHVLILGEQGRERIVAALET
jgi:hypothetical protein